MNHFAFHPVRGRGLLQGLLSRVRDSISLAAKFVVIAAAVGVACASVVSAATLEVGPGKRFARIEEANAAAEAGDVVLVYPRDNGAPYEQTAVYVRHRNLTFRAAPGRQRVRISGEGFNYSGRGSTPRAIFQFNRGTDHCVLEGFELYGAHNNSHNGAGVRINQANHVLVSNCRIHHNDMGIMSNGDGTRTAGAGQGIERCIIDHNGDYAHPGFNHNLYLGGTSVTLSGCEVHSSLTGHNVKSRAHHTRVEYCYVHSSANREFDLVDAADTEQPDSHAVIMGCVVVKNPTSKGNRAVLHFGQDGGRRHDGTVFLAFNTIFTPFVSPVVELSTADAKAHLVGNLVCDGTIRQNNQQLVQVRHGASLQSVTGLHNWFSGGFSAPAGSRLDAKTNLFQRAAEMLFVNPAKHDYRLKDQFAGSARSGLSIEDLRLPSPPDGPAAAAESPLRRQYRHPADSELRAAETRLTLGAYGRR